MLRQPRIQASRASPAQKSRGLRVVSFQKLFQGYIFCFLEDSFGRCIFEQYARETNLKKKRSARTCDVCAKCGQKDISKKSGCKMCACGHFLWRDVQSHLSPFYALFHLIGPFFMLDFRSTWTY